jgi:hypothetical protein
VVGQGLAGPLARDEDAAADVAEVLVAMGFALAQAGDQAGPGTLRLYAVAEPVRAPGRARLIPRSVSEPRCVITLSGRLSGVASGDLLGQVLGEVADAASGVFTASEHALGVELRAEPGHMAGLILGPYRIESLAPGGQQLAGCRVHVPAHGLMPDGQLAAVAETDLCRGGPPHLVIGRGDDLPQIGTGDRSAWLRTAGW